MQFKEINLIRLQGLSVFFLFKYIQKCTARVIADSILNLKAKGLLDIVHSEADVHAGGSFLKNK